MTEQKKKNCVNCKWLEWFENESDGIPLGGCFICNKRTYNWSEIAESKHHEQLKSESYREKSKVCHE